MMPALEKTGLDGQGCCGRHDGHGHEGGGHCCGGRGQDGASLSREEEIAALELQIADSRARLDQLRRG